MKPFQYVNLRILQIDCFFGKNPNNTTVSRDDIRQLITLKSKSKIHPKIIKVKG